MNLVFIGASKFGLRCLEACLEMPELSIVGVVTAEEVFSISYRPTGVKNVLHADVLNFAKTKQIPVEVLKRSMNEEGLLDKVKQWKPDAFLVAGWYHMIPSSWRKIAVAYGLHASLLPDYSGGAPLVWAMINGETRTGITLFQMNHGVDSGPIAGQREVEIYPEDDISSLYCRIENEGLKLIRAVLPDLCKGTLKFKEQDESQRRLVPQRSPSDGLIDWSKDAAFIDRFVRAQTHPYPGAFTLFNGKPLHIWKARISHGAITHAQAGFVCRNERNVFVVHCKEGAIELTEVSYEHREFNQETISLLMGLEGSFLGSVKN